MFATLKADLKLVEVYVIANYKQLLGAAVVGKFSSTILAVLAALVHSL